MKSRRSSDRRRDPGPQPEFLIDRSLSQVSLPAVLREADLIVHTLAEIYGEKNAQAVEDTEWIALAAERDLVVFCKDDHIPTPSRQLLRLEPFPDTPGLQKARSLCLRCLPRPHHQTLAGRQVTSIQSCRLAARPVAAARGYVARVG
jgi:hypothetical protein